MDDGGMDEWIDRTNEPLKEIGNGYDLTPTLQSLHLTNNRISKIERLENCAALRELVLRQNVITTVEGLDKLHELTELDLYMNQINSFEPNCFVGNPKLQRLDLSFNQLRTLKGFPSRNLGNLEELFIIGNKIREISDLHSMPKLVMLELGDNRLRTIEALDSLPSLHGLWLGRNKIARIEGLTALTELRRLSLQSNRIQVIEGLSHLPLLEELYLSHNGISSMQGIQSLTNLRVLDLAVNFIEHIECVENLTLLKEFWMNGNKLESFEELQLLQNTSQLETVYLEGNPLASDANYQAKALEILPDTLEQLDALLVEDVKENIRNATRPAPYEMPKSAHVEELQGGVPTEEDMHDAENPEETVGNGLSGRSDVRETIDEGIVPAGSKSQPVEAQEPKTNSSALQDGDESPSTENVRRSDQENDVDMKGEHDPLEGDTDHDMKAPENN